MVRASHLKSIPLFAALDKRELRQLADYVVELRAKPGDRLLNQGAYAFEFLAIAKGEAEVIRDGEHVADLGPGEVVGEIAALTHGQRSASVVAKTKATVIYMRAQDFRHFVTEIPALGEQVHKLVAERSQTLPDDPGQPESV